MVQFRRALKVHRDEQLVSGQQIRWPASDASLNISQTISAIYGFISSKYWDRISAAVLGKVLGPHFPSRVVFGRPVRVRQGDGDAEAAAVEGRTDTIKLVSSKARRSARQPGRVERHSASSRATSPTPTTTRSCSTETLRPITRSVLPAARIPVLKIPLTRTARRWNRSSIGFLRRTGLPPQKVKGQRELLSVP